MWARHASCAVLAAAAAASAAVLPALPLHTQGRYIVDSNGARVKLACVNHYGAEELDFVVGGLQAQPLAVIAGEIAAMGFNCVRLPWSLQLAVSNPQLQEYAITAEPLLQNATALEGLDATIAAYGAAGLMVVLDNHMSDANWCCSLTDGNGLWYTDNYTAEVWLETWAFMARRYVNVSNVIGADLRNELRPTTVGGQFLLPSWGDGNVATDWHLASTQAGTMLQTIAPDWLIIVEGILSAADLTGIAVFPVVLPIPNRVVYEAHNYIYDSTFNATYDEFAFMLDITWGFILNQTGGAAAPVWLGEFGTCNYNTSACVNGTVGLGLWWQLLGTYMAINDIDFGYWAVDGTQSTGTGRTWGAVETYGLLNVNWSSAASEPLLASLQSRIAPSTDIQGLASAPSEE